MADARVEREARHRIPLAVLDGRLVVRGGVHGTHRAPRAVGPGPLSRSVESR
ncbi:hypothetical protein ACH4ZU_25345 [Streptomyces sp. NPDC020472]|uniref:hypothetical protein n=1 Tax=Streptomyces sp. NPDC020472 TaxID=3365075 RepID=UPI0037B5B35F